MKNKSKPQKIRQTRQQAPQPTNTTSQARTQKTPQSQTQPSRPKIGRYPLPFIFHSDPKQLELKFYEQYDESYLFNKAVTLLYAIEQGDALKQQVQEYVDSLQGGPISDSYFASLKAELFFMTLHQFESFFALLIAAYQKVPTWPFLTAYTTEDMKDAIKKFIDGDLDNLTDGICKRGEERKFLAEALYMNSMASDPDVQSRWDENLDNIAWLVSRIAEAYLANLTAYNSYKHGLRTIISSSPYFTIRKNDASGTPTNAGFTRSAENGLTYLELEKTDEGTTVHETTKFFDPGLSAFYVVKLHQMIETIKATRLASLRGDIAVSQINYFLNIDKQAILTAFANSRFEFTLQV